MNKKGQAVSLGTAPSLVITLVVIGIVLALGLLVLENFQGEMTAGGDAYNATSDAIAGVSTFSGFQSVIAVVLVTALILGLVALIAFGR